MDEKLQTFESLENLIMDIGCLNFEFLVREHNEAPYLQIIFESKDVITSKIETQYCRKWALQYTMADTEVVRTAYKAAEAAVIHELQESFIYKGTRIFDPHLDVNAIVDWIDREGKQDIRVKSI